MKPKPLDLKKMAVEIAELSADEYECLKWWGHDTDIGDLPSKIRKVIERYLE